MVPPLKVLLPDNSSEPLPTFDTPPAPVKSLPRVKLFVPVLTASVVPSARSRLLPVTTTLLASEASSVKPSPSVTAPLKIMT